jgi:hypothetical protein
MQKSASPFWTILLMSLIVLVITWPAPAQRSHSVCPAGVPNGMNPPFPLRVRTVAVKQHQTEAENAIHTLADSLAAYLKVDNDNNNNPPVITAPNKIITWVKTDLLRIGRPAR